MQNAEERMQNENGTIAAAVDSAFYILHSAF
jgi:hypothetical protein